MKVYHLPDLDGLVEAAVAAPNLGAAAVLLGVTAKQMRERGWGQLKGAASVAARKAQGAPIFRALYGQSLTWTPSLNMARGRAAKAATRRA